MKTGVILLLNRRFISQVLHFEEVVVGRCVYVIVKLERARLAILGIYAPAVRELKAEFFETVRQKLNEGFLEIENKIMLGDFNCVEIAELDRSHVWTDRGHGVPELITLRNFIQVFDTYREKFPNRKIFTFFSKIHKVLGRLDRIYASRGILEGKLDFKNVSVPFSDHNLVTLYVWI